MLDDLLFGVRLMHGLGRGHGFESGCSDQTQTPVVPSTLVKSSVLKHDDIGSNPTRAQHRAFGSDCQAMLFYGTGQLK